MIKTPVLNALFWVLFTAATIVGCGEREKPLVKATEVKNVAQSNLARLSIGLRIIQDSWVLYRSENDFDDWKANSSDLHLTKRVFKSAAGNIVEEEDYYYSGAKFTDREGTWSEFVTVNYSYESKQIRVLYTGTNSNIETKLSPFGSHSEKVGPALAGVEDVVKNW